MAQSYATGERCDWCGGYLLNTDVRHQRETKTYHAWCVTPATQLAECWLGLACQCCDANDVFACELRRHCL